MPGSPYRRCAVARRAVSCRAVSITAALGWFLALAAGPVHGLGLGEIVEQSSLGEPLRFAIPVLANSDDLAGDELAPECFMLVPTESARGAELPQIRYGRATLERNAAGVRVVVTSSAVARDPALSFAVQAGCRLKIRHEYTVLLDPPIIREPLAEAQTEAQAAAPAPARRAPVAAAPTSRSNIARVESARPGARSTSRSAVPPRSDGKREASASEKRTLPAAPAAAVAKEDAKPRLSVSRSVEDRAPGTGASDIAQGKSDEQIRRDVEAETVVLQRRIAELSVTLQRMEAELREATAARDAAERAVKVPPPPSGPDPWLVTILLGVIVLALVAMLVRSRRAAAPVMPTFAGGHAAPSVMSTALGPNTEAPFPTPRRPTATAATIPPNPELDPSASDDEDSFDEDLLRYAQQSSAYSALEREHPKLIASVVRDWGEPKVIAYLREILVNPRKGTRPFSREAVSDLIFLQGLAMEHAGYGSDDSPWQIELDGRSQRSG
jgi:hypothetical protein